jgi:hypothetical protein
MYIFLNNILLNIKYLKGNKSKKCNPCFQPSLLKNKCTMGVYTFHKIFRGIFSEYQYVKGLQMAKSVHPPKEYLEMS